MGLTRGEFDYVGRRQVVRVISAVIRLLAYARARPTEIFVLGEEGQRTDN